MLGRLYGPFALAMIVATATYAAESRSCGANFWPGTLPEHEVDTVSVSDLQSFLDSAPIIDGIKFDVSQQNGELWLDIVAYPGEVPMLASIRSLLVIGRVVRPEYDKVVLADNGDGIFEISYSSLHAIGCQFVWGVKAAGQNPIALNRDMADALRYHGSGGRVAPPFNGSLMGDTNAMLSTFNDLVYPQWVLKSVKIE